MSWYIDVMTNTVCELSEVGQNIERARLAAGVPDLKLAEAAGVHVGTLSRWKGGLAEPGARLLALAALKCDVTPNDLLLRAGAPPQLGITPDPEDIASISRVHHTMNRLKALRPAGALNCWEFFANILEEIERNLEQGAEFALPAGTKIQHDKNVRAYEPYDAPSGSKGPPPISKVSEAPARFGKKKRVVK